MPPSRTAQHDHLAAAFAVDLDDDRLAAAVLHGVFRQVAQDRQQLLPIAVERRQSIGGWPDHADAAVGIREVVPQLAEDGGERHLAAHHRLAFRLQSVHQPADVQQAGEVAVQVLARGLDLAEHLALLGRNRAELPLQQEVDVSEDDRQRRAQLVRDRAEELGLDAVGFLGAVALLAGAVDEIAVEGRGGEQERNADQGRR
ncbi:MAG: hypothetical protein U0802_02810 [Candidatus Binatia bacterium]